MEIILHIGLHKTGTKFLQHKVFKFIETKKICYNPPKLTQLIADLLKSDQEDIQIVQDSIDQEIIKLKLKNIKKILISREIMSGNLFDFYKDFDLSCSRLAVCFSDRVKVICFLRFQMDWIKSCYRETLHEHHYQTINQFLGFEKGDSNFVKAKYTDLSLLNIVNSIKTNFKNNCHFFYFEDFKEHQSKVLEEIKKIIGIDKLYVNDNKNKIPNRGYSSFSISLSIFRYKLFRVLGLNFLIHRPIVFFGTKSIPAGFENLSVLDKEKYWGDYFLKDNQEKRSDNYPNLSLIENIKLKLSWRYIIKNVIDKVYYWDKDFKIKNENDMRLFFIQQNQNLKLLHKSLVKMPKKYISNDIRNAK
ncbi:hypothetical protein N9313_01485 [Flavobacteriaceae bacterium]|nr:hypothetical protein [Flavobacteriaceae bacterium]